MNLNVYSIRDLKAGTYAPPFFMSTHGQALRAFSDLVNDQNSTPAKHPEDFTLFHLGTYDDHTGTFETKQPSPLANALDFRDLPHGKVVGIHKE